MLQGDTNQRPYEGTSEILMSIDQILTLCRSVLPLWDAAYPGNFRLRVTVDAAESAVRNPTPETKACALRAATSLSYIPAPGMGHDPQNEAALYAAAAIDNLARAAGGAADWVREVANVPECYSFLDNDEKQILRDSKESRYRNTAWAGGTPEDREAHLLRASELAAQALAFSAA